MVWNLFLSLQSEVGGKDGTAGESVEKALIKREN